MVSRKILSILLLFIFASCSVPNWYKPMGYRMFRQVPEGGTPGFRLGWIHGCESGLGSQFGGALMMNFYTWAKDPDIASSNPDINKIRNRYKEELKDINWDDPEEIKRNFRDYNIIFWNSHIFCRHSILGTLQSANMTPPLPGEARFVPGANSISNLWTLKGKGDTRIGSTGLW